MRLHFIHLRNSAASAFLALTVVVGCAPLLNAQNGPTPQSSEVILTINPAESNLHWNVDSTLHMVHGTFLLKSGTMHFNPATGDAGGEIIVSATSGESGNGSRDKRMHKEILETEKYPEVIFHPKHLDGKVNRSGPSDVKLAGTLSVHGSDHELTAIVHAELAGDHWTGTGKFEVPYVNWGIKDPSNFLLKVKPVVNIDLEMSGSTASR
jgi:polyisoprenoid-binding protein YceI